MTIRKTGIGWLTALMLISGCQSQVASDDPSIHQQEAVSEVIIPASLLDFANTDIEENAESGTRTAYIEPAVDFTAVSHVYVLMPSQEQAG